MRTARSFKYIGSSTSVTCTTFPSAAATTKRSPRGPSRNGSRKNAMTHTARTPSVAAARLVTVGRPEPRGIGRQDLVDDQQRPVTRRPEFELGVGDDDPALGGIGAPRLVEVEAGAAQALGRGAAQRARHVVHRDVLVVPLLGLRGRREDRRIEPLALQGP